MFDKAFYSNDRIKHVTAVMEQYPKAKKLAVRNFIGTVNLDPVEHPFGIRGCNDANLSMDANSYSWNEDTKIAIRTALRAIYKEANIK